MKKQKGIPDQEIQPRTFFPAKTQNVVNRTCMVWTVIILGPYNIVRTVPYRNCTVFPAWIMKIRRTGTSLMLTHKHALTNMHKCTRVETHTITHVHMHRTHVHMHYTRTHMYTHNHKQVKVEHLALWARTQSAGWWALTKRMHRRWQPHATQAARSHCARMRTC